MVFLHIIFGMFAFIDTLGLGVASRDGFIELSTPKKAAATLSYVSTVGLTVLGFASTAKDPFVLAAIVVLVVAFSVALFKKNSKETSR